MKKTKRFNVTGACEPGMHYMVDLKSRLEDTKELVDSGAYFTIHKPRQYGKTTLLASISNYLRNDVVINMDFQMIGTAEFQTEEAFSVAFLRTFNRALQARRKNLDYVSKEDVNRLSVYAESSTPVSMSLLFEVLSHFCAHCTKPVVLIIDEVDSAKEMPVFEDFLAQLRAAYLYRNAMPTFHSVILCGVTNLTVSTSDFELQPHTKNYGPWNIAMEFPVEMKFNEEDIQSLLVQYENDYHTQMDIQAMAKRLFTSTGGYPFLVSKYCKTIDEEVAGTPEFPEKKDAWTQEGFHKAEHCIAQEIGNLFASMVNEAPEYAELKEIMRTILFRSIVE